MKVIDWVLSIVGLGALKAIAILDDLSLSFDPFEDEDY